MEQAAEITIVRSRQGPAVRVQGALYAFGKCPGDVVFVGIRHLRVVGREHGDVVGPGLLLAGAALDSLSLQRSICRQVDPVTFEAGAVPGYDLENTGLADLDVAAPDAIPVIEDSPGLADKDVGGAAGGSDALDCHHRPVRVEDAIADGSSAYGRDFKAGVDTFIEIGSPLVGVVTQAVDPSAGEERGDMVDPGVDLVISPGRFEEGCDIAEIVRGVAGVLQEALDLVHCRPEELLVRLVKAAVEIPGQQHPAVVAEAVVEKVVVAIVQHDAVLGGTEHREGGEILAPLENVNSLLDRVGKVSIGGISAIEIAAEIEDVDVIVLIPVGVLAVVSALAAGVFSSVIEVRLADSAVEVAIAVVGKNPFEERLANDLDAKMPARVELSVE